ncbi:hypothetical protein C8N25_101146 [Algoriphagus antarcticus]|uniref:Uncharacterized protein n=1 Tax=Algoriphagus antarcticus TaxID=238540 RepID=A0A3E0EAP0_9BACT|nr:hypothetical protein C8N25_101146 [Algoriphagus antarcticus]
MSDLRVEKYLLKPESYQLGLGVFPTAENEQLHLSYF